MIVSKQCTPIPLNLHPDVVKKLDDINHHLKDQQNSLIEPMKQYLNEKLNPLIEQQTKKMEKKN
jgi:hypothetical protein